MTMRLEYYATVLALQTSCEGAAILLQTSVCISGDAIIDLLLRRVKGYHATCGSNIGIDDWAYKKVQVYGTLICDGDTHLPVELLEGRDGAELKKWLEHNRHVRTVTRDRASAYAKVLSEALPEAAQVADRFHLYQNLYKAIHDALNIELPKRISVPDE